MLNRYMCQFLALSLPVLVLTVLAGCGPTKPELFRVRGRIVDAETKQGLAGVRLLLRAAIPTDYGSTTLKSYGVTAADGSYDVELSEGSAVLRYATDIRLEAAKQGYSAAGVGVPAPIRSMPFFKLGDIVLARAAAPFREGPPRPPPGRSLFREDPPPRRR